MKDLLYKEFKLAVHPSMFIFLTFGALLLIPSWLFFIAFGYIFIGFMNMFFIGRGDQDFLFTVSLPIRKRDVVRARFYALSILEVLMILASVPFAIIHGILFDFGNMAMNLNFAFFGFVFVMYAVFNAVFFPMFYKTAYKAGVPVFLGVLAASAFAIAVEFAVHAVPVLTTTLNAMGAGHLESQLPVLIAGIGLFALLTWLAFKKSAKNFEKVDL